MDVTDLTTLNNNINLTAETDVVKENKRTLRLTFNEKIE